MQNKQADFFMVSWHGKFFTVSTKMFSDFENYRLKRGLPYEGWPGFMDEWMTPARMNKYFRKVNIYRIEEEG